MDQQLERLFNNEQHLLEHQKLKSKVIIISIPFLYGTIDGFINENFIGGFRFLLLLFSLTILVKYGQKSRNFFDISLFIIQQLFHLSYFFQFNMNREDQNSHIQIYIRGLYVSQLYYKYFINITYLSILLSSRLSLKLISLFAFALSSSFLEYFSESHLSLNILVLLISGSLSANHCYMQEKQNRSLFKTRFNSSQWQKSIDSNFANPIIQCLYNKRENSIDLQKMNSSCKEKLKIANQNDFKKFLRDVRLINEQKIVNLEQLIFYLFENPKFCQKLLKLSELTSIFNSLIQMEGMYHNKQLEIQIFACYEEMPIVILNVNFKPSEDDKFQLKLYSLIIQKIFNGQGKLLRNILIRLKFFQLDQLKKSAKQHHIAHAIEKFYLFYNMLLNVRVILANDCQLYQKISRISLKNILTEVLLILSPDLNHRQLKFKMIGKDIFLQTNELGLKQLLLNILSDTINESNFYSTITIQIKTKQLVGLNEKIVELQLCDNGKFILQKQIDCLSLHYQITQNSNNEIVYIKFYYQQLKLGLISSCYLVGLLGPTNQIVQRIKNNEKIISFQLLINLTEQKLVKQLKQSICYISIPLKIY